MTPSRRLVAGLTLFWLVAGAVYTWAAWQQKTRVNLSAAAGGQMPYLAYAEGMAEEGLTGFLGDRNRMPLYPALLTVVYDRDWGSFVKRSAAFAIVSSLVILIGIGLVSYTTLSVWPATALTLTAAYAVFIYKASFVQAELLYYGLLFASWLAACRLIRRPRAGLALVGGVLLALTYLTKASGAATLVALGVTLVVEAIALVWSRSTPDGVGGRTDRTSGGKVLLSDVALVATFAVLTGPYLAGSKERFGRYFYNVNSTFFMWCDSWAQAKAFGDRYHISERYPDAAPGEIPGAVNYWKTHTAGQMLGRLGYGLRALGSLAIRGPYFKYLVLTAAFCIVLGIRQRRLWPRFSVPDRMLMLFCVLFFGGYMLSYTWYAQVAYGDRFLLSLFLPAMYGTLWMGEKLARQTHPLPLAGRRFAVDKLVAMALIVLLIGEGAVTATTTLYRPGKTFVQFYYNESRELYAAGNLAEAAKGFAGVIQLDPEFVAARHGLGMIALESGRIDEALVRLTRAAQLSPNQADVHNSLGSALVQAGRLTEAVEEFNRAVDLDPQLAVAWYNLGGSYHQLGDIDQAKRVQRRLQEIDPHLARQLAELIGG